MTSIGLIILDEIPAAIHTLDTLLQPPNTQKSLEATVMLASLRAHPRPGISSADMTQEKARARDLFDRVWKSIELDETRTNGHAPSRASRAILDDMDMHAEIARLWQGENIDRMRKALKEALRISESTGNIDPRLLNNLGVLQHLEGNYASARNMYETGLTTAAGLSMDISEAMSTSILYNLARVYEDQGEEGLAKEAYEKLLSRHPEYVDGMYSSVHWYASALIWAKPKSDKLKCFLTLTATMMPTTSSNSALHPKTVISTSAHFTPTSLSKQTPSRSPKTSCSAH
jgi:RNA polymerase-associated protein CTR9